MKFLALSHDAPTTLWDQVDPGLLQAEAHRVHELYLSGCLREIHFTDAGDAVLMLECSGKEEAGQILRSLPLVHLKLIDFEVLRLHPYPGLKRIIAEPLLTEG